MHAENEEPALWKAPCCVSNAPQLMGLQLGRKQDGECKRAQQYAPPSQVDASAFVLVLFRLATYFSFLTDRRCQCCAEAMRAVKIGAA